MIRTLLACSLLIACGGGPGPSPDGGGGMDSGPDSGPVPCTMDSQCTTYCAQGVGTRFCCQPANPPYEICGDRIDQDCDHADESCGDTDRDGYQACRPGENPVGGVCDCNDVRGDVHPMATEACDDADNDCNGRIDEASECCGACAALGADSTRGDVCTPDGMCDCSTTPGVGLCAPGLVCCTMGCIDVRIDPLNCGFCNSACTRSSDHCADRQCRCGDNPPCDLDAQCSSGACAM